MSDDEYYKAEAEAFINGLIEEGLALRTGKYDEDGDEVLMFDLPRLDILYPEFAEAIREAQRDQLALALAGLYSKGLVDIEVQEDGEVGYRLTDLGHQVRAEIFNEEIELILDEGSED